MKFMKAVVILMFLLHPLAAEEYYRFSAGAGAGLTTLTGGNSPWYTIDKTFGVQFDTYLKGKWRLGFTLASFKIFDDTSAHSEFKLGSDKDSRVTAWRAYDLTLLLKYRLSPYANKFSAFAGFGGGLSIWKVTDAKTGSVLKVTAERGETVDLAASEVLLAGKAGVQYRFHETFRVGFDLTADYLTGAGREFESRVEDRLSKWNLKAGIQLSYLFGHDKWESRWGEERSPATEGLRERAGISAKPKAIAAVSPEASVDSDQDGVPDINDECPKTPSAAHGLIDIRGCPVDSDCDAIPDYRDNCPNNPLGSLVDEMGCPLDGDKDGVPDGLDDCPDSEPGLAVDRTGCIDLSELQKPMVLNIKYQSGSFEIDRSAKSRLDELSRILLKATGIKVEINGYTDNIGTSEANKALSQKRANRVRDYLVTRGVDAGRLIPIGRGEVNFIASNAIREGRQKNRRIELVFFR
jgi:outer membrane protein OmpA-like peptidoglycan-associated protein